MSHFMRWQAPLDRFTGDRRRWRRGYRPFEESVIRKYLFYACPGGQEVQHVGRAHPLATDARPAAALAWLDGDSTKQTTLHGHKQCRRSRQERGSLVDARMMLHE